MVWKIHILLLFHALENLSSESSREKNNPRKRNVSFSQGIRNSNSPLFIRRIPLIARRLTHCESYSNKIFPPTIRFEEIDFPEQENKLENKNSKSRDDSKRNREWKDIHVNVYHFHKNYLSNAILLKINLYRFEF